MGVFIFILALGTALFLVILGSKTTSREKSYDISCIDDGIQILDQIDFTKVYECVIIYDYFSGRGTMRIMVGTEYLSLYTRSLPLLDRIYHYYKQHTTKNN